LIQTEIEDQLSDMVLAGEFKDGEDIIIDAEDGKLVLRHMESSEEADEIEEPVTPV
jgi:ATP-dependent Clp protease ATP-binding subunit ClpC